MLKCFGLEILPNLKGHVFKVRVLFEFTKLMVYKIQHLKLLFQQFGEFEKIIKNTKF